MGGKMPWSLSMESKPRPLRAGLERDHSILHKNDEQSEDGQRFNKRQAEHQESLDAGARSGVARHGLGRACGGSSLSDAAQSGCDAHAYSGTEEFEFPRAH